MMHEAADDRNGRVGILDDGRLFDWSLVRSEPHRALTKPPVRPGPIKKRDTRKIMTTVMASRQKGDSGDYPARVDGSRVGWSARQHRGSYEASVTSRGDPALGLHAHGLATDRGARQTNRSNQAHDIGRGGLAEPRFDRGAVASRPPTRPLSFARRLAFAFTRCGGPGTLHDPGSGWLPRRLPDRL